MMTSALELKNYEWMTIMSPPVRTRHDTRKWRLLVRVHWVLVVLLVICIIITTGMIAIPARNYYDSQKTLSTAAHEASYPTVIKSPSETRTILQKAHEYNEGLLKTSHVVGEPADPLTGDPKGDFSFKSDKDYWSALNVDGKGSMGSLRIPSIGVDLPINHGSDSQALEDGIGHLHGSSLPVGGKGTNSVLTGHRGLPDRLLLTRLNELGKGGVFYINVLGNTLAYRVDSVKTVDPKDMDIATILPDEDRVTLVTCTPYGINTQRLIVSGVRVPMPGEAPYPSKAPGDTMMKTIAIITLTLILVITGIIITHKKMRFERPARHLNRN